MVDEPAVHEVADEPAVHEVADGQAREILL